MRKGNREKKQQKQKRKGKIIPFQRARTRSDGIQCTKFSTEFQRLNLPDAAVFHAS